MIESIHKREKGAHLSEDGACAYIIRMKNDELERQLFLRRWLYVGLTREWARGSYVLFIKRAGAFIGSGVIRQLVPQAELDESEKQFCLQNNFSAKIVFEKLARFIPPVSLQESPIAGMNPLTLHGLEISMRDAEKIEALARSKVIT